jgi:hypothetical protein
MLTASATTTPRPGNPNLARAPRCGARTRCGCPCQAPAIRGKQRCRMHGGRSTGPRTAAGRARIRAARTIHGGYGAQDRAWNRLTLILLRRGQVLCDAHRYRDNLPEDLCIRLDMAPELLPPLAFPDSLSPAQDRAIRKVEAEALAPWKATIAQARGAAPRPSANVKAHAPAPGPARSQHTPVAMADADAPSTPAPEPALPDPALPDPALQVVVAGRTLSLGRRSPTPGPAMTRGTVHASPRLSPPGPMATTTVDTPDNPALPAAQPHAPAAAPTPAALPHAPRPTFRQHLQASTPHGSMTMLVDRFGWDTLIRVIPTLDLPLATLGSACRQC